MGLPIVEGFTKSLAMTVLSEIGDKTFFASAGKDTSDPENGRQCPFFDELHAVFTERANNMQRLLIESEAGGAQTKKKMKRLSGEKIF